MVEVGGTLVVSEDVQALNSNLLTCLMSGPGPTSARVPSGRLELLSDSDDDTDDEYVMQDDTSSEVEVEHDSDVQPDQPESEPLNNDDVDDITMNYASGSVIFSVQGVKFKVGTLGVNRMRILWRIDAGEDCEMLAPAAQ